MNPIVSVVIVTLNAEKHIETAIRSFLSQTYESKELVIVDGNSSDETINIVRKFDEENIHWISEHDKGVFDAMNKGIRMSMGEWIYFLGADDFFIDRNVLENIFCRDLNDIDVLYGDVYSVLLKRKYDGPTNKDKLLFRNLCHQSVFYRKEVFEKIGLFNIDYKLFSDWEFNLKCFLNDDIRTLYIPIVIAQYAATGISTISSDLSFLRDFLFPENLKNLNKKGIAMLNNIKFYDRWWRLVRSLRLANTNENLEWYAKDQKIPIQISRIFYFQKKIPQKILWTGVFSKALMTFSYLTNR